VPVPDTLRERGEVLLRDPLSDIARKERRALLAVATIGYIVVRTGLVPEKIEALGVTFSAKEQGAVLAVFGLVVIYFTVTFVLYAATDALALAWHIHLAKRQLYDEVQAELAAEHSRAGEQPVEGRRIWPNIVEPRFGYKCTIPVVALLRGIWDFVVPVVIGVVAAVLLLRTAWT
jgi:hypothetical protein